MARAEGTRIRPWNDSVDRDVRDILQPSAAGPRQGRDAGGGGEGQGTAALDEEERGVTDAITTDVARWDENAVVLLILPSRENNDNRREREADIHLEEEEQC